MQKYIVAEVSKNWPTNENEIISQKFEKVINVNDERGYELLEWKLTSCMCDQGQSETIVAIFKKKDMPNL